MAMVVKNNMSAKNTLNQLDKNDKALSKSLKKVASGMKINSAADDASGYAISERMETQIRSLDQDNSNTQNAGSLMKVAEGAVASTVDILKTLKEKVINAANDTNTDADRKTIQKELDQSLDQIDDNANVTFNGKILLDGSKNNAVIAGGTATCLTNESFAEDTGSDTLLTELKDRSGALLGISTSDKITISYVKGGKTYSSTQSITEDMDLAQAFNWTQPSLSMSHDPGNPSFIGTGASGADVYTADGKAAMTFSAGEAGVDGQIAGLTVNVTDKDGNVKKSVNATFDNFTETIRAQNQSEDNALVFQTGTKANQSIKVGFTDMRSEALGLKGADGTKLDISTQVNANAAISVLDNAVQKSLDQQTTIGSVESRLEYTSANLTTASENVQSSNSVIRDADMAKEMTDYTKNNVLLQAAQAMLSQANQNSSSVLSLLK
jgi:flagellin